ncbi:putative nucleic acid-binding protein [Streptacidiphilus sp. BW17]|uniref:PIN domain nuclease n=1 Tax=Streptacidiphilus sp. BW17 TaxID=3156274 RepID=UPI003515247A
MRYLADTSALARLIPDVTDTYGWLEARNAGLVAIYDITELEVLHSARSATDRAAVLRLLNAAYAWTPTPDGVYRRAREVQHLLTDVGEHRSASPGDLLVAATAELAGLTLLHCDRDFETIAKHTGQPTHMLAAPPLR